MPLVSVIMSVHNCEKYLAEAVRSVLGQTFGDFEFIIIDDGSSDRSLPILREFAAKDDRIRLVSRPNTGLVAALNEAIELSKGKYLPRMDADDKSMPDRFAKQVAYLESHPDCVMVGSRVMMMDPYGSPVAPSGQHLTHEQIEDELLHKTGWALVHPSVMMRRDAVVQAGMYRPQWKHCEDHDLFLRLAEVGKVANLPEVLLWYRRHYQSINFTKAAEQTALKEALLREAHARRGSHLPDDWKQERWTPPPLGEQLRLWGWAALKAGNVNIARKHAAGAIRVEPLSIQAWKLMYCAIRGR